MRAFKDLLLKLLEILILPMARHCAAMLQQVVAAHHLKTNILRIQKGTLFKHVINDFCQQKNMQLSIYFAENLRSPSNNILIQ